MYILSYDARILHNKQYVMGYHIYPNDWHGNSSFLKDPGVMIEELRLGCWV